MYNDMRIQENIVVPYNNKKINLLIFSHIIQTFFLFSLLILFIDEIKLKKLNNIIDSVNTEINYVNYIKENSILKNQTEVLIYINKFTLILDEVCSMIHCN